MSKSFMFKSHYLSVYKPTRPFLKDWYVGMVESEGWFRILTPIFMLDINLPWRKI